MASWIRKQFELNSLLRELKYTVAPWAHAMQYYCTADEATREYVRSIKAGELPIFSCPDYHKIAKSPDAGKLVNGKLVMHNGVKVLRSSYYGYTNFKYMQKTLGVHEPQEEYVFGEVLKDMPANATMLELGAYWGFYSLWFRQVVKNARCLLVEPLLSNLNYGKKNFQVNNFKGEFFQAYVGQSTSVVDGVRQICIDDFMEEQKIERLNILHSDIQGFELEMLKGAEKSLRNKTIDYCFISTHSNELHRDCIAHLQEWDYTVIAACDLDNSFSPDGVIVACRSDSPGAKPIVISQRAQLTMSTTA